MKNIAILAVLAALLTSSHAFAQRWIIKNPKNIMLAANLARTEIKQVLEFGGNTYAVVESQSVTASMQDTRQIFSADDIAADLPIDIIESETDDNGLHTTADNGDWFVNYLQYNQLPAEADGRGIVVAVLDTGVKDTHPNLQRQMWTNPGEIAGNGIDDDGNGYVDDIHGYDFAQNDSDPTDGGSHGTHVAGSIVAFPKGGADSAQGAALGAKVMSVRIIGGNSKSFISGAAAGIKYAVDNGAHILSNSWRVYTSWRSYLPGHPAIQMLREAIAYAGSKDVIFVAAAGNESKDINVLQDNLYPAGYDGLDNLFVVAANTDTHALARFTNYGNRRVHVSAPGNNILSTVPWGWGIKSGTSMATPIVSGILARGLSAGMTPQYSMQKLQETAGRQTELAGQVISGIIHPADFLQ